MRTLLALLLLLLPATALAGPGTVAVLYFDNQGNPALEPLKVGLADMLITDLQGAAAERYTVVERSRLQALLDELELGHGGVVDPDTAARVGKLLGAEWLVLGSYFELVGTLRVDARLVKVETGEITFAHGVNGQATGFIGLEQALATALSGALAEQVAAGQDAAGDAPPPAGNRAEATGAVATSGEVRVSEGSTPLVVAPDPEALEAAVAFSEGLILMDGQDLARAREAFETAIAKDPSLAAAKARLAELEL